MSNQEEDKEDETSTLFFVRSGHPSNLEKPGWETPVDYAGVLVIPATSALLWSTTSTSMDGISYGFTINPDGIVAHDHLRYFGFSLRCLAI